MSSNTTGWVKDGDNSNYPLISGIGWRIRVIFHVLNKQRLRFDLVYRTLGYIFMYLGKSGISLRQASKKAKLDRNSLINNLKNVTFNIPFWINFHYFYLQNVINAISKSYKMLNISDMISHSCDCSSGCLSIILSPFLTHPVQVAVAGVA